MKSSTTSCNYIARAVRGILGPGRRRKNGFARDSRGAAAVEFGILLPFMVVLLAGIADLGRSIWQHHTLQKGVRDAARYLSRVDPTSTTPPYFTAGQLAAAKNLALRGSFDTSRPYPFGHWSSSVQINTDSPQTSLLQPCPSGCVVGGITLRKGSNNYIVTVTATVNPPAGEFPLLSGFGLGNVQYSARHQMRLIGE